MWHVELAITDENNTHVAFSQHLLQFSYQKYKNST